MNKGNIAMLALPISLGPVGVGVEFIYFCERTQLINETTIKIMPLITLNLTR